MRGRLRNAAIITLALICVGSLVFFNYRTYRAVNRLYTEIKETAGNLNQLDFSVDGLGDDLNEVREFLGLKTNSYGNTLHSGESDKNDGSDYTIYYNAVDRLLSEYGEARLREALLLYSEGEDALRLYEKYGLTPVLRGNRIFLLSGGAAFFTVSVSDKITAETHNGSDSAVLNGTDDIRNFLERHYDGTAKRFSAVFPLLGDFEAIMEDPSLSAYLKEKKLYLKEKQDDYQSKGYDIHRSDGSTLCSAVFSFGNGVFTLGDTVCTLHELKERLFSIDSHFDIRTVAEKKAVSKLEELKYMVNDDSFRSFLDIRGCVISPKPSETEDSYDFVITDSTGRRAGKISMEKSTGEIYIFDKDNVVISSVKKN